MIKVHSWPVDGRCLHLHSVKPTTRKIYKCHRRWSMLFHVGEIERTLPKLLRFLLVFIRGNSIIFMGIWESHSFGIDTAKQENENHSLSNWIYLHASMMSAKSTLGDQWFFTHAGLRLIFPPKKKVCLCHVNKQAWTSKQHLKQKHNLI